MARFPRVSFKPLNDGTADKVRFESLLTYKFTCRSTFVRAIVPTEVTIGRAGWGPGQPELVGGRPAMQGLGLSGPEGPFQHKPVCASLIRFFFLGGGLQNILQFLLHDSRFCSRLGSCKRV